MNKSISILLVFAVLFANSAFCAATGLAGDSVEVKASALPEYTFPCTDGLYATIGGFLRVKDIKVKSERSVNLKVPGFVGEIPVQAVIQPHQAPLAVVILGLGAKAKADYSKVWPSWLAEAGYHVLYFDSTVGPSFQKVSHHGVSGNVWIESERIRDIIAAFLNLNEMRDKVSAVGITGYSYGAVEALVIGQMAAEGHVPFQISAIQAFGPPVDLLHTAAILDTWYREDRWSFKLSELKDMFQNLPTYDLRPAKISESSMRAAISAVFRIELADIVMANDAIYKLGMLPKGNEFDDADVKREYAETYGFTAFAYEIALPYWEVKIGRTCIDRLVGDTNLCKLIGKQPSYSEIIVADDDPFNTPADFAALKTAASGHRTTILPHGGHIGYMSDPWTHAKLLTLFSSEPATTSKVSGDVTRLLP